MENKRIYGIDFLRILAMFFVIVLHSLGKGGLLDYTVVDSPQYKLVWFMEVCAYCAVNIFALISGYVSYKEEEKRVKYSNYITIWFQVVFYGILITAFFQILGFAAVTEKDYFITLFPVTNNLYWYFTAYTGLFVIMPFLNKAIRKCSKSSLRKIFVVIILVFSIFATITNTFNFANGYTFVWVVILYILGAIIKKCEIGKNIKTYQAIIGIVVLYILTYINKIYGQEIVFTNIVVPKDVLMSYTSPTILGAAILYVIGFSKVKFHNACKKLIKFATPATFSIYIINNHRLIWEYVMKDLFINICNKSITRIFINTIGFSILFVIGSILIDKIRIWIFKVCHVTELSKKIENILNKFVTKIGNII